MRGWPALTGVRGLAAISVVLFHLYYAFAPQVGDQTPILSQFVYPYGWLGVDLFFVLSGFLLSRPILARRGQTQGPSQWLSFWKRRWMRIAPPYYVSIILSLLVAGRLTNLWTRPGDTALLATYTPNFVSDVLGRTNLVYWTLAVEFQFYIFLPILLWVLLRSSPWVGLVGSLAAAMLWDFGMYQEGATMWNFWSITQLPSYVFHFAAGITAARLHLDGWRLPSKYRMPAVVAAVFAVVIAVWLAQPPHGLWAPINGRVSAATMRTIPAAAFALFVFLLTENQGLSARILGSRPFVHLGDVSYSLYLVHGPIITAIAYNVPWATQHGLLFFHLVILVPVAAATYALHWLVERPSLAWKERDKLTKPTPPTVRAPTPAGATATSMVASK